MALFENFPYTNLHELNLDWVIKEIEDLKEGQVLSVNGETGDVILYQDNDILFPAVTDSHWSMVRSTDGTTRGIMFGNDNKAYIVHGNTMEQIYSATNQPPYPVESVNGKTGAVNLFTDNNGVVSFPAVTDPDIEGIIIGRSLNGQALYLKLNDDGTASITKGNNEEFIYTTADTDLNVFPVPEAGTTETGTNNKQWGVVREVNSGDIGLLFNLGETPEVYIRYRDSGLNWQNVKLLTNDDIPSSSGVVSFNGQTGAVSADANNLQMGNGDTRSIADAIDDIIDDEYQMDNSITYTERGNTATQNIPLGKYVIWKNKPYISITNISFGDTLSSSNLIPLDHGIVDNLLNTVNNQATQINMLNSKVNYDTLINLQQITSSYVTRNTYNSRKFSDYKMLVFTPYENNWAKASCIVPAFVFENATGIDIRYYHGGNLIEVDIKRTSDTSYDAKYIGTPPSGEGVFIYCFGLLGN